MANLKYDVNVLEITKLPEILKVEDEDNEEILAELLIAVDESLNNFINMREIEGQKLVQDINTRLEFIKNKVQEIESFSKGLVEEYIQKLETRINELLKTDVVDKDRLAQEIVIFSDKSSIEEELTRLNSHIAQFENMLQKETSPIGKKFDFLVQEMNREVNTIGSKANCLEITNRVIELKTEIENIREQIQNIE